MRSLFFKIVCFSLAFILLMPLAFASSEHVEGLEYTVNLIKKQPFKKYIKQRFDFYEIYLSNNSFITYSIPGYSVDLGAELLDFDDVFSQMQGRHKNKILILNLATTAASVALGGGIIVQAGRLTYSAARSAVMSGGGKSESRSLEMLSNKKTYILYPGENKSLFLFVRKSDAEGRCDACKPKWLRFICRDEENSITHVVINKDLFKSALLIDDSLGVNLREINNYVPNHAQNLNNFKYDYYKPVTFNDEIITSTDRYNFQTTTMSIESRHILLATPGLRFY